MPGRAVVRPKLCTACKTCELQCALAHSKSKNIIELINEEPIPEPLVGLRKEKKLVIPAVCSHCEDPPCVKACPSHALYKQDGVGSPTLLDESKCCAQQACITACPVGALQMNSQGKIVLKCDQCIERQEEGLIPACADGCPTGAIEWHAGAIEYKVDAETCTACGICKKACPVEAVTGKKKTPHEINAEKCIKCGACFISCPFDAINVVDL